MSLLLPDDVAAHLGINRELVIARCRTGEWPHMRVGKFYRFTPMQLEAIEAACTVAPKTPAPEQTAAQSWGVISRGTRTTKGTP